MVSSFTGMRAAGKAMGANWITYFQRSIEQIERDVKEHIPHFKAFYRAIPAFAIKKLHLDVLDKMIEQLKDHCGKVELEYCEYLNLNGFSCKINSTIIKMFRVIDLKCSKL